MTVAPDRHKPRPISRDEIFSRHERGKLSVQLTAPLDTPRDLSVAYTPGVAEVCKAISADRALADDYTWTKRLVVVVSDGSAVLGLGDTGLAHRFRSWKRTRLSSSSLRVWCWTPRTSTRSSTP